MGGTGQSRAERAATDGRQEGGMGGMASHLEPNRQPAPAGDARNLRQRGGSAAHAHGARSTVRFVRSFSPGPQHGMQKLFQLRNSFYFLFFVVFLKLKMH